MSNGIHNETVESLIIRYLDEYKWLEIKVDDNNYNIKKFIVTKPEEILEELRYLRPFAWFFNPIDFVLTIQL